MNPTRSVPFALVGALALVGVASGLYGHRAHAQSASPGSRLGNVTDAPAPFDVALSAIPNATAVRIRDGWMGLSRLAPLDHRFEFGRVGNEFRGHGVCSAAGQQHALADVTFPAAAVTAALSRLVRVSVTSRPYAPLITHTDDYPSASIELDTPAGTVTFATHSQGRFAPPWQITVSGTSAVVSASVPGEVLSAFLARIGADQCGEWVRTLQTH